MSSKDPRPEIMRLEEVALLVKGGEIKLPKFQRPFVWKRPDMLKLLDSIYKGYPIGSILIWNSSQRLTSERSIAGLEVDEQKLGWFPTNYLLDGQQRLTTLCGALFWTGNDSTSIWNIHFDLDKEEFIHPVESDSTNLFPLNKLIDTSDFIRQCMRFEHHAKRSEYVQTAQKLLRAIKDYKIAVVKIGDMTLEEVAPIFERINSTGRKLTMVDLMMAATWSNGFDLTNEINLIKVSCKEIGFSNISDQVVLRSISAAAGLGINKDDIQRLRSQKSDALLEATGRTKLALREALIFFKDEIGICDLSYVPYGFQLTYVTEFFRICKSPTATQIDELRQWFWFTSVTRYFGTSNSGQNSKDLANIRRFASGEVSQLFKRGDIDISRLLFDQFNLRNATSTTFALLLARMHPLMTIDGRHIDDAYKTIKTNRFFKSVARNKDFVYNVCQVIHPFSGSILTINENPETLKKHLLGINSVDSIRTGDDESLVIQRAAYVLELVESLTSCSAIHNKLDGAIDDLQEPEELVDPNEE
jgi:hypothetical protein